MDTVRTPRQKRSAASLERLLAAAEEVLRERSFDAAGVAEIAARAGVTVGAFYSRFEDKESLLRHLEGRVFAAQEALIAEQLAGFAAAGRPLAEVVHGLLRAALAFYRTHRGSLRALDLRARSDAALRDRISRANQRAVGRFVAAGGGQDPPGEALGFAVLMVGTMLREAVLFGAPWLEQAGWDDETLVRELTRAFVAYLGAAREAP